MEIRTFGKKSAIVAVTIGVLLATTAPPAQADTKLDPKALQRSLNEVHEAGMYGIYTEVRDGRQTWRGASGVADVDTGRPVHPGMVHRVGSITKTFVSVAVLQQVARGAIDLDAPIGGYLPDVVPGERGQKITVRMLLNHTSHIADYVLPAFPSFLENSPRSLDDNRFRTFTRRELAKLGLDAPPTGEPGVAPGSYSNTGYAILGLLLEKVTGTNAEEHVTRNVIRKAGLRHTSFPRTPRIPGPHSKAYERFYGLIDPPRDYSVYNMSWASTAGAIVSTMDDINRFYRALLGGRLIGAAELAEMRKTVPVWVGLGTLNYGLGLYTYDLPCGRFWGHSGGVFGMATESLISENGDRQLSMGVNLTMYHDLDENRYPLPHPIDRAFVDYLVLAACGQTSATRSSSLVPFAVDRLTVRR
ncbi:serine hydrolase domain-containing protein [Nonomuraea sp. NPDC050404]|uniref:serine hydrolase domain-containing protein n=1 Tax=Nonomuraea sp. NPDC050404 TaxID=3155783 RepID=UPI0033D61AC6